ncbi:SusD/RagB family nutrient-binding outer membrane lipoprotein [Chitinophaga tropicalis]|uniref:SusD/RagB family nutrient-binding outer membrane lipoprotein n=1 Tax=Chitinophaga tropicalis TaxID=2683588 RepID=A0A7K1UC18_9BACT|nr:SusD/RagB family nutrient-binding outer membrane lipoprotein [Chitinophaga tropicalis]MVT11934.1 SusD/RagB family nutrient-binding outer membrane lipoprotein [Chitinophaga tropicalis]
MKSKYIAYTLLISGVTFITGACNKFVDINTDPNNPTTAQLALLLPSTEVSMGANMYELNSGTSTFMQHTVSNADLSRYQQQGTSFDESWDGFYSQTLSDLQDIIANGTASGEWGYVAIAKLEKAYLVSMMVDMWGDIPYFDAEKGEEAVSPGLNGGREIYEDVLTLIDSAIEDAGKINTATLVPASADMIYNGVKASWLSMANSLKLKLYNQLRLVDPARSLAAIQTLINNPSTLIGGTTNTNATDYTFKFGSAQNPNNRHPWHRSEYQSAKNFYMCQSFMDLLFNNDDPRLRYFIYRQNATAGLNNSTNSNGYYGRNPGDGTAAPADLNRRSTFGVYPAGGLYDNASINNIPATYSYLTNAGATSSLKVVGTADGTGAGLIPLITNAMVKLIRAEAAMTLNTGDDARQNFSDGVTAHLNSVSVFGASNGGAALSSATITGFVNKLLAAYDAADDAGKLNMIMTQKYIACYGNGMEAYTDYRRTGLPVLRTPLSPLNTFPLRLYYSQTELSANTSLGEDVSALQIAQQTTPVFWDK